MPLLTAPSRTLRGSLTRLMGRTHLHFVHLRRVRRLADAIVATGLEPGRWLDIGCGDGRLGRWIMDRCPGVQVSGVDVQARADAVIPVREYDGRHIKSDDRSFTGTMLIDVLHHADNAEAVVREALRVSRTAVIIKDVAVENWFEHRLLTFMDFVGNSAYGVDCPGNYLCRREWRDLFARTGCAAPTYKTGFRQYPRPLTYLFDGRLHFIATLRKGTDALRSGS